MGRPVFKAAGALASTTTTTLALVAPTLSAGDTMVAIISSSNNTASSGMDARFLNVFAANNTAAMRTEIYILSATTASDSGATFNFTVNGTTLSCGVIVTYGGCSSLQSTANDAGSANSSSATVTWPTYTCTSTLGTILAIFNYDKNGVSDGGISAGTPTFTNRFLGNSAVGGTAAIGVYDGFTGAGQVLAARTMATGAVAAVNEGVFLELIGTMDSGLAYAGGGVTYGPINRLAERV